MELSIPAAHKTGQLPEDWKLVLLDDVAKRGSGHTPSKGHPDYWNGEVRWISLADSDRLDHVFIDSTAANISEKGLANSSAVLHPAGTVVMSRDAGVGKSAVMRLEMAVSQHFMAWQCGSELNNIFLYYTLQRRKREFERIAAGSTIKTIGLPFFKELTVLYPPKQEQDRIAAAMLDADALIDSLEQLLTKKRQIKQGAMQELLTGQRRLPGFSQAWTLTRFGDIGRTYGGLTGKSKADFGRGDARYVTFMNVITNVRTSPDALESVRIAPSESQNMVQPGDLLFNGSSETPEEVALCSWVERCEGDVFLNSFCFGFRPFVPDRMSGLFMAYFFRARPGRNAVSSLAQGATRYNIAKTALLKASLNLPSFEEQKAIAEMLSSMDTEITSLESRLTKARALKQAMAQALLTGRIRLVEPTA